MDQSYGGSTAPRGELHLEVVRGGQKPELSDAELIEAAVRRGIAPAPDVALRESFAQLTDALAAGVPMYGDVPAPEPLTLAQIVHYGFPRQSLPAEVRDWRIRNFPNLWRGLRRLAAAKAMGIPTMYGALFLTVLRGDGEVVDLGLASLRVVTDVGCQKIVAIMNTSDASTAAAFKYHGLGTGTTAEAAGDTALVTELTTEYNPDSTRATGSQTTGATTKVYRTVGTNTLDSGTPAVTEHGVFSAASAGSLLDRSKFSAINLVGANGDGIASTYDFTTVSGS